MSEEQTVRPAVFHWLIAAGSLVSVLSLVLTVLAIRSVDVMLGVG